MITYTREWEELEVEGVLYMKVTADIEIDPHDYTSWDWARMLIEYENEEGTYTSSEIVDLALCDGMDHSQRTICRKRMQHRFKQIEDALRADIAMWLDLQEGIQQEAHEHNQPDPDFLYDQSKDGAI